ncbi:hypothetical protein PP460_gp157 [Streptomyces phage Muntaha]|uniref:Uncharacterized protein n=1 Tax=Streptomyces phage Muntaha TaxID=2713269 RepID=A0A6G8R361_9CAUD|nr:hypothetical protein PP460_gp157 [Streptomyces phage Muntaha]QIN94645.1 hypothetical protein SEA_MUNTAHA_97 [Streptomyces phage Muntaha]
MGHTTHCQKVGYHLWRTVPNNLIKVCPRCGQVKKLRPTLSEIPPQPGPSVSS